MDTLSLVINGSNYFIALMPAVFAVLLLTAKTDKFRRFCLAFIGFGLFSLMLCSFLMEWMRYLSPPHLDPVSSMFQGVGALPLRYLFNGLWPPTIYAMIVGTIGYFATERALRRINGEA